MQVFPVGALRVSPETCRPVRDMQEPHVRRLAFPSACPLQERARERMNCQNDDYLSR